MTYLCICNMKNMFRTHDIVMFINDDISGGSRIKTGRAAIGQIIQCGRSSGGGYGRVQKF